MSVASPLDASDGIDRSKLVEDNLSLGRSLASRMSRRQTDREDVEQVAMIGLLKAAERFDEGKGAAFSTFAWQTVQGEIKRYFRDHTWSVHVNRGMHEREVRLRASIDSLSQQLGRSPMAAELADDADCTVEQVLEVLELQRSGRPLSIMSSDDDDAPSIDPPEFDVDFDSVEDRHVIASLSTGLRRIERAAVYYRFYEDMSQMEIAQRLGVSQMQVSRLLERSLRIMREKAAASDRH
jgi:RNA polymerase sigma-B factor